MKKYNKLVRDKIPDIMGTLGKTFNTRTLDEPEYVESLRNKLQEEAREYLNADNDQDALKEMADMLEVMHALVQTHHATFEELELIRQHKRNERGAFKKRVYLMDVEEDKNA
ncbi:nucleoside triphosphate pyrophosphohydrolase [Halobacillus litoralis]|uniref:nucleoside triphosphate pyrophosphohydrolase n=1 Tax=Halobacillus litoralis TaxID=45668 RepID=UPI001CD55DCB|nr:nucleoside triphosphate pyrophosphohydrolase [Halobacillus litoralis]MCA0971334.1 nucleoside triphosphate pyrophosphohydrolase [Halobacillus litoralis]